nr:sodium-dependent phosphate transport protein 3-like [Procambarus clarkii]
MTEAVGACAGPTPPRDINHHDHFHKSGCAGWNLPLRYVVVFLGLLGSTIDYLVRNSISVAIVAMVNTTHTKGAAMPDACPAAINTSYNALADMEPGEYDWSLQQQGVVLATFFWGYFITKTLGGRIAEVVGARETMGWSLGVCGVLSLLCPAAAHLHPLALAAVRLLMGVAQGPAFPALYSVLASWSPPEELATMVSVAYSGGALGSLIALGVSAWVVEWLGWRWVFWGGGLLALTWAPLWFLVVRNTPHQHPCISERERKMLISIHVHPGRRIPWRSIARCKVVYLLMLVELGNMWVVNFSSTQGPTFLINQVGLSMKESGWALMAMAAIGWVFYIVYGWLSDLILRHHLLSKLNTRRLMHITAMVWVCSSLVGIVLAGCRAALVAGLMQFIGLGLPATITSFQLTPMDIAPNYAGTLAGLIGLGDIAGFVAPIVTSHLISLPHGWEATILLSSAVYLSVGLLYVLGLTADVYDWNYYDEISSDAQQQTVSGAEATPGASRPLSAGSP